MTTFGKHEYNRRAAGEVDLVAQPSEEGMQVLKQRIAELRAKQEQAIAKRMEILMNSAANRSF